MQIISHKQIATLEAYMSEQFIQRRVGDAARCQAAQTIVELAAVRRPAQREQ